MSVERRHHSTIDGLARGLPPVARLAPPWRRVLGWGAVVCLPGLGLAAVADAPTALRRLAAEPALALATAGSAATALLAAIAAVLLSLPDRDRRWALLPLAGLAPWICASLVDGMTMREGAAGHAATFAESCACVGFILGLGAPFALLLTGALRRGHALWPGLTAGLAGLAAASVAASLLGLFHPFEAALDDLALHALAVAAVAGACAAFGHRLLGLHRRGTRSLFD